VLSVKQALLQALGDLDSLNVVDSVIEQTAVERLATARLVRQDGQLAARVRRQHKSTLTGRSTALLRSLIRILQHEIDALDVGTCREPLAKAPSQGPRLLRLAQMDLGLDTQRLALLTEYARCIVPVRRGQQLQAALGLPRSEHLPCLTHQ